VRPAGKGPLDSLYFDYPVFAARAVPEQAGVATRHDVVIAGAGPVGLAAAYSAQLLGASVVIVGDMNADRLAQARSFGCETVDLSTGAGLADMIAELRQLNPKPGLAFGSTAVQPIVPDVFVRAAPDGSWLVELNSDALPRVLVNQTYAARVSASAGKDSDKTFVAHCLQTANWLTKSLEQRARTILKVSSEIVRQQDAFFAKGVEYLRPLNLKTIADAIGMHESTVSRVTSSKYMATPRGLFELKYFFTASIGSSAGGESHSAESVRFKIKQLIDSEGANDVLSDDAIVLKLKEAQVDIARRTVAKYRESLRIPSSVERRREKAALAAQLA